MARIRKDDLVEIIAGKDKGLAGRVLKVFPAEDKCLVEKANQVKKHQKAKPQGGPSGIVEKSMKLHMCKVMLIDPKTQKPSRVRFIKKDGQTLRQFVKSGEFLDSVKVKNK